MKFYAEEVMESIRAKLPRYLAIGIAPTKPALTALVGKLPLVFETVELLSHRQP